MHNSIEYAKSQGALLILISDHGAYTNLATIFISFTLDI